MRYNYLICGDGVAEMFGLPDSFADMVVTDPPYNARMNRDSNLSLRNHAVDETEV